MARRVIVRGFIGCLLIGCLLVVSACSDGGDDAAPSSSEEPRSADASALPFDRAGDASADPPAGEPAPEGIDGVIAVEVEDPGHVSDRVEYDTYPPVGGDHFPIWQSCGFYDSPVVDEPVVHALEHGAVWIAYDPALDPAEIEVLSEITSTDGHILTSPYPGLRSPIVVTSWGRQLDLDSADDPRIAAFIDEYVRGSLAPEPGASCQSDLG